MKNIKYQYKKENTSKTTGNFWLCLLHWLRLLTLSLTRAREHLTGKFFHRPESPPTDKMIFETITKQKTINNKKITIMKPANMLIKWGLMLLLTVFATNAMAQYPNTGAHSVCLNAVEPYGVVLNSGSTYAWSITPATGGTITPGATPNLITVTWTAVGTYTLEVIETNADGCPGDPVSIPVTVNALPVITISGPTPVCLNSTGNVYITETGMTNYVWVVNGGTVTGGGTATDNTITVTWDGTAPYNVSVVYTDPNGCTQPTATVYDVVVNPLPTITISGPTPVCLNSIGNVYTTQTGMTNYIWVVNGGTVTSGGTASDNTITVTWDGTAPYNVSVVYTDPNGCTQPIATVYDVTINPLPIITIAGPTPVCLNSTGNVYTTQTGMTNYIWVVNGGTITAGGTATDNTVTVTWNGTAPYNVSVVYTDPNGCTQPIATVYDVTINPLPIITITGPAAICLNAAGNVYTTEAGMTNYIWVVNGGTITAGGTATDNTVTVTWDGTGPYSVTVVYTDPNGCTQPTATVYDVVINPLPTPVITGPAPTCESVNNSTVTYTTPNVAGNTYLWVVSAGGTIIAGQGTNSITVQWNTAGAQTVQVTETVGGSGCSAVDILNVTVTPKPITTPITHN